MGGDGVSLIGQAGILHVSFVSSIGKLFQGEHAGEGPTWSSRLEQSLSDPHLNCCELQNRSLLTPGSCLEKRGAELAWGQVTCSNCCIHLASLLTLKSWLG